MPGGSSALWICAPSFSGTSHVIILISLAGKHVLRAVCIFILTLPGGQNLISQAVFLIQGKFPLRMFLFIFGIIFSHLLPRFSENSRHRRDFPVRKILLKLPPTPPPLFCRIVIVLKLILEKVTFCSRLSLPRKGLPMFPTFGEFRGGEAQTAQPAQ